MSVPHRRAVRVGDVWEARAGVGKSLRNIAGPGHIDGARFVFPIKRETEVTGAGPFGGEGAEWLEGGVGEMMRMLAACVLYSEVIPVYCTPKSSTTELKITGVVGCRDRECALHIHNRIRIGRDA
jgi:hypothetical protein